jgi:arsenate reductase-like glutaredoxin family protein
VADLHNPNKVEDPDYRREIAGRDLSDEALLQVYARFPDLLRKPIVDGGDWALAGYQPDLLAVRCRVAS